MYNIITKGGEGEIIEKKSRFIATVRPVESEEEATAFIGEMKKKYWDARHNCSAFVIGDKAQLTRCSDDGEPSGTAGRPMLEVLLGAEIRNAAVVVTRYFGGTLLGTGGLVRAYTQAVHAGLARCEVAGVRNGVTLEVRLDYNDVGKALYLWQQRGITPQESKYTDAAIFTLQVPVEDREALEKELTEATAGRAVFSKVGEGFVLTKTDRL